jgi:predicted amidohydrolase YtcJ
MLGADGDAWHHPPVKTLYRARRVHTLGHPASGEWVLVDDRHVQLIGEGDPPRADRTVELPGATIVPGLIDAHVHLTSTGAAVADEDVRGASSAADILRAVEERAAHQDGPIALQGFDESTWADPALPTLAELDAIERPVVVRRTDGHVALVSTAALHDAGAKDADGVERGPDGAPTGVVRWEANRIVGAWVAATRSDHRIEELQLIGAGVAARRGVTAIHEMALPEESGMRDVEVLLGHRARLPVDVDVVLGTMDVPAAVALGLPSIGGDLPADGSIGALTAAVTDPYEDAGGVGQLAYDDETLRAFFRDAHEAGLQAGVHALGDRAIEQAIAAWESIARTLDSRERRHLRARRHRIEHFELPTRAQIERAAMLGIAVSAQPTFDLAWGHEGGLYEQRLGGRAWGMNPFRTLTQRGLLVGVGSDAPVVPMDPWLSVHALEHHHDPMERMRRLEALRLHTAGSARLAHREDKQGMLEPGMHADLAAYDADPLAVDDVRGLRPILTISLGREVWLA